MITRVRLLSLAMLVFVGCVSDVAKDLRTKEGVARWYSENRSIVRLVGYQGTDREHHHFVARVMDTWQYLELPREALTLQDERLFVSTSASQLYFYRVDPARNFEKLEEDNAANQSPQPTPPSRRG